MSLSNGEKAKLLLTEVRHLATSAYSDVVYNKASKASAMLIEDQIHRKVDEALKLLIEIEGETTSEST